MSSAHGAILESSKSVRISEDWRHLRKKDFKSSVLLKRNRTKTQPFWRSILNLLGLVGKPARFTDFFCQVKWVNLKGRVLTGLWVAIGGHLELVGNYIRVNG